MGDDEKRSGTDRRATKERRSGMPRNPSERNSPANERSPRSSPGNISSAPFVFWGGPFWQLSIPTFEGLLGFSNNWSLKEVTPSAPLPKEPICQKCNERMRFSCTEPDKPGFVHHVYECLNAEVPRASSRPLTVPGWKRSDSARIFER